jgi:hypothetical protein
MKPIHHQEHLNCIYSLWYYTLESLPAGFMEELKLASQFQLSHETSSSSGASKMYLQPLVLYT